MPSAAQNLAPDTFWKLFHNILSHGTSDEEHVRSEVAWRWVLANLTTLRKVSIADELGLLNVIWVLGSDLMMLPSYDLLKDRVNDRPEAEARGMKDLLTEYDEKRDSMPVFAAKELPVLLKDHAHEFGKLKLGAMIQTARTILEGHEEVKVGKKIYRGLDDAVAYVQQGINRVVVAVSDNNAPIDVKAEATLVPDYYYEMLGRGVVGSGFAEFNYEPGDFIGFLGYASHGKSPMFRYSIYQNALQGKHCLHVALEDDKAKERNKYIFIHSRHPKFNRQFDELSYERFRRLVMSDHEMEALRHVAADFENEIGGNITIIQPTANWEEIKSAIIAANQIAPIDVAGIDYLQLVDPPGSSGDDARTRSTSMIKDARQFVMNWSPRNDKSRAILLSPVQANEAGLAEAEANGGVWPMSAVNNDKELLRSMTMIVGVFRDGPSAQCPGGIDIKISKCKARDGVDFQPFLATIDPAGWIWSGTRAAVTEIRAGIDAVDDL